MIILDKDSLIDDNIEITGNRIVNMIYRDYPPPKILVSQAWYNWIVEYWPGYYSYDNRDYVVPSRLHSFFKLLGLSDYFAKVTNVHIDKSDIERMRDDIVINNRLLCFGTYFPLEVIK